MHRPLRHAGTLSMLLLVALLLATLSAQEPATPPEPQPGAESEAPAPAQRPDNSDDAQANGEAPETSNSHEDEDTRVLAWSLQVGDRFYLRVDNVRDQLQRVLGRELATAARTSEIHRYEVLMYDQETERATLQLTYLSAAIEMNAPGNTFDYDSRNPEHDEMAQHPSVRPTALRVGESVRFSVDRQGNIRNVQGYAALYSDLLDELREAGPRAAPWFELFAATYSDDFFTRQQENIFKVVPGRAVTTGASWPLTTVELLPGIGSIEQAWEIKYERASEHEETARRYVNLTVSGTIQLNVDEVGNSVLPEGTSIRLRNGTVDGTLEFDEKQGRLNDARVASEFITEIVVGDSTQVTRETSVIWRVERLEPVQVEQALGAREREHEADESDDGETPDAD